MATERQDEVEYESDPEETKRSIVMRRRRAASDDEEEETEGGGRGGREGEGESDVEGQKVNLTVRIRSDESDGAGGAADYEEEEGDEVDELDGEEEDGEGGYDEEEEDEEVEVVDGVAIVDEGAGNNMRADKRDLNEVDEKDRAEMDDRRVAMGSAREWAEDEVEEEESLEGEKKENEPYAVPTAGAFYMHDDRFRDNVGGRNR